MAFYKVLAPSFIGQALVAVGQVVDINDDPANGGMTPRGNLAACDADGNMTAARSAARGKKVIAAAAVEGEPELA